MLYVFGGGDGPTYSNDVWAYHTREFIPTISVVDLAHPLFLVAYEVESKWVKPNIITPKNSWPLQRRAHTTVHYKDFLVVFGGGNGQAALNDVWALKISDPDELTWEEWKATGDVPVQKGYHTANLVGSKMLVYGGSDGNHSFSDIHVLDLGKQMQMDSRRLLVAHDPDASGVSVLFNPQKPWSGPWYIRNSSSVGCRIPLHRSDLTCSSSADTTVSTGRL